VRRDREPLELSALELKLLRYLVEHRGTLLTRDELLEKVWGYDATPVTRTVDVHIASLRQKLGAEWVLTVHGLGYKFVG
jgi:DNA-binding response OmpR family regulator